FIKRTSEGAIAAMRPQTQVDAIGGAFARGVAHQFADSFRKFDEVFAVAEFALLAGAGGHAFVGIDENEIDVGSVVELARAKLSEGDDAKLRGGDSPALVAQRRAVTIVEVLTRQAQGVIQKRIGEV